jgi:hypothetical protein
VTNRSPAVRVFTLAVFFGLGLPSWLGCVSGGRDEVSLTSEERQKITEIVLSVAEDPEDTVKPARDEIWSILKKRGTPSVGALGRLKNRLRFIGEGHRLFWLDAREALKSHHMVKSPERARWEDRLSKDGWLSAAQRGRFDELMKQVMGEEPIASNHGVEVALNSTMMEEIVNSWDGQELDRAIALLLTPPD